MIGSKLKARYFGDELDLRMGRIKNAPVSRVVMRGAHERFWNWQHLGAGHPGLWSL